MNLRTVLGGIVPRSGLRIETGCFMGFWPVIMPFFPSAMPIAVIVIIIH